MENKLNSHRKRPVMFKDGNLFFTKEAERRFFFMTLIMLASGAVIKLF
jgi:hypothetical protein